MFLTRAFKYIFNLLNFNSEITYYMFFLCYDKYEVSLIDHACICSSDWWNPKLLRNELLLVFSRAERFKKYLKLNINK